MNEIKIKVYSIFLELKEHFFIEFEDEIQSIIIRWNRDPSECSNPNGPKMYAMRAECRHQMQRMHEILLIFKEEMSIPNSDFELFCIDDDCEDRKSSL